MEKITELNTTTSNIAELDAPMSQLIKATIKVMSEVQGMEKNSRVGTGNSAYDGTKYKDVAEVFNRAMIQNGLVMYPIGIEETTQIDRWEQEDFYNGKSNGVKTKQSIFTKVKTKYLLAHVSGASIELVGYGHGIDNQDKGAGKATTYALKNCLLYTFLTPVGKIDDTDTTHSNDINTPQAKISDFKVGDWNMDSKPIEQKIEPKPIPSLNAEQFTLAMKSDAKGITATLKAITDGKITGGANQINSLNKQLETLNK